MPRKGENIYKRKDGRWEGRYKRGKNQKGKTTYGYVYAKTYKDVREKLTLAKHNTMHNEKKDFDYTFSQISKKWLEEKNSLSKYHLITNTETLSRSMLFPNSETFKYQNSQLLKLINCAGNCYRMVGIKRRDYHLRQLQIF